MKTSAVLASVLFGAFAVAAPVDRRALVYKTELVTETVIVYTTVYDDDSVPEATTTADATTSADALFYEHPKASTTSAVVVKPSSSAVPTSSAVPAYTPAPVEESSSVYTAPPQTPTPTPTPTPSPTPTPQPETTQPTTTEQAYTTAPAASSAASAPTTVGGSVGEEFSNVDITIYDNTGAFGACGTALYDTDMIVALAQPAWGASTYDVMTGAATNPWCGQKIKVAYEGNEIEATIMDLCPGCSGHDIDLSLAAWKALTGLDEKTRLKASWSKMD